jgi:GH15 family glucan-1,4-alpha-glucosidase
MTDDRYPPQVLREYAFLADGERGVIVGPRGEFCWMCAPRWDGDAVFASLVGGAGSYAVTPRERFVWGGAYEPGSLIWRSARLLEDGPRLKPAYTCAGGRVPDQRRLDLPGYPGGYDRVGNLVTRQFQLDCFGDALLLFAAAARHDRLDADALRAARTAAAAVETRWREPDAGIWELEDRLWTHSRLNCAAGLRGLGEARWSGLAETIVADTRAQATHPSGRWQRAPDDPRLDGALLLPAIRGAVPDEDPRTRRTLDAYVRELTDDGYAYRFRHDDRPLGEAEGAFLFCGFLIALTAHQQGDLPTALRWFERNRAACGPAGLLAEEYDVSQRQMRGNLPQAFVHALLLECAVRLNEPPGRVPV